MKRVFLIGCILLLLLFGGATWLLLSPQQPEQLTSPLQPSPTVTLVPTVHAPTGAVLVSDTKAITRLVSQFYTAYLSCLKEPPSAAKGKVAVYCRGNTGLTTAAFVDNILQGGTAKRGADPITCSQNPPASVSAGEIDYEAPDRAVATAITVYGAGFAQKIPLVVVKEAAAWRIDNVNCARL